MAIVKPTGSLKSMCTTLLLSAAATSSPVAGMVSTSMGGTSSLAVASHCTLAALSVP